uniref:DWNN domain-containing protein n=1 Tax=Manihot esculenta TaxID=3983 RepID=A0A2C9WCD2_MANES
MPIYFKFFSAKEYDFIPVDGSVISVDALKRKFFESKYKQKSKGSCLGTDLDLVVVNAQTNDCYVDDMLIPNNTRVLIRRVPGTRFRKPISTATIVVIGTQQPLSSHFTGSNITFEDDDGFGDDDVLVIPRMQPVQSSKSTVDEEFDEDSKIKALVNTPALDWQPKGSNGVGFGSRGVIGGLRKKIPPQGYICHRCKVPGHFIQHCPTNGDPKYDFKRVKPPTGIPKSMLMPNPDGSYKLSSGATAVLQPNNDAFEKEILGCFPSKISVDNLPPELLCPLCKQVMRDAVLTSKCCFKSFCDTCIRVHLITSKLTCACGATNVLTDYLIPNMTLRDTINCFVQSGSSYSSTVENAKSNSFPVKDMESSHCSQAQISTTKLSAESFEEEQKPSPSNVEDKANERKPLDAPRQMAKKARTEGAADVSEATIGSIRTKDTASQGSILVVGEEVQQKDVSVEGEKKRKERKVIKKKKRGRNSQDVEAESYMMPVGSYAYNPHWIGMQAGLQGYMAPYYAAGAMSYGWSPFGTTFNDSGVRGYQQPASCVTASDSPLPEIRMGQFKILENLMLPLRSLDSALEILLVGRPMYGIIRQAMETVLPRLSGRPPLQFVVRAPKRFWADERSAPSSEKKKEISLMPPSPSFDINGSGENDQLIVPFDVKYQYYARLWCEAPVLCGTEICCAQSSFWR